VAHLRGWNVAQLVGDMPDTVSDVHVRRRVSPAHGREPLPVVGVSLTVLSQKQH